MKPLHELDALCAEKVAGWTHVTRHAFTDFNGLENGECWYEGCPPEGSWPGDVGGVPPYTTDPAAVLGLLEKYRDWSISYTKDNPMGEWAVRHTAKGIEGKGPTFALAATLALLNAHGVETE